MCPVEPDMLQSLKAKLRRMPRGTDESPLRKTGRTHFGRWVVVERLCDEDGDPSSDELTVVARPALTRLSISPLARTWKLRIWCPGFLAPWATTGWAFRSRVGIWKLSSSSPLLRSSGCRNLLYSATAWSGLGGRLLSRATSRILRSFMISKTSSSFCWASFFSLVIWLFASVSGVTNHW